MRTFSKILHVISLILWLLMALIVAFSSSSIVYGIAAFALMAGAALLSLLLVRVPILGFFVPHVVFFGLIFALAFAMQP